MRKNLLCSAAVIAISAAIGGTAIAADAPIAAPIAKGPVAAPPLLDWSGLYIGGHLGWGRARTSASGTIDPAGVPVPYSVSQKPSGIVGGMHIGQNWQAGTTVYGWEADLSATGWNKRTIDLTGADTSQGFISNVNLLASLRGRLGMAFDQTHLYVTGGLAYTHAKGVVYSSDVPDFKPKLNNFGGVVGLGAEWKQTPNLSWRLEGLWYFFDKSKSGLFGEDASTATVKLKDAVVVRVGATHHFATSDRRLKRDIALVSLLKNGLGLYRYRYLWSDQVYVGVMAQEVAKLRPDAVVCGADGYLRVDYRKLGLRLMTWDEWTGCAQGLAMAA